MAAEPRNEELEKLAPRLADLQDIGVISSDGSWNWDRWTQGEDALLRADIYVGIIAAIMSQPSVVPDPLYWLVAKGFNNDTEAIEAWEEANPGFDMDLTKTLNEMRQLAPEGADIFQQAIERGDSPGGEPIWDIASFMVILTGFAGGAGLAGGGGGGAIATSVLTRSSVPAVKAALTTMGRPLAVAAAAIGEGSIAGYPLVDVFRGLLAAEGIRVSGTVTAALAQALADPEAVFQAEQIQATGSHLAQNLVFGQLAPAIRGMFGMEGGSPGVPSGPLAAVTTPFIDSETGLLDFSRVPTVAEAAAFDDPPIGVPVGYEATRTLPGPDPTTGQPGLGTFKVPAQYMESDWAFTYGNWTPGQIIDFQTRAIKAGVLDPQAKIGGARYIEGNIGEETKQALAVVMDQANTSGWSWNEQLDRMVLMRQEDPAASERRGPFVRSAYMEPDYATLAQTAKTAIRSRLGRDINDWELALLSDKMKQLSRAEFDAAEAQRLETWEAEGRAMDLEERISTPEPVQGVDSGARFAEFFESKFGTELDRAETTRTVAQKTSSLMGGIQRMADMMGGS
jgi:hypothetical protein